MDGIQASILDVKLNYLNNWIEKRNIQAEIYQLKLSDIKDLILPVKKNDIYHSYHLFVVRVKYRKKLIEFLKKNEIQTGIHYPISLPKLKAYKYLKIDKNKFKSFKFDNELLSLPIGEHLTQEDIIFVCNKIINFYQNKLYRC